MIRDPYQVLGLPPGASPEEIKKAYRRKAKEYHPDLHPGDANAARKMNEINEAYDMLTNPEKYAAQRRQQSQSGADAGGYRAYRQNTQSAYQGPGGWASDFGAFNFDDIFGFGFGAQQRKASTRPGKEPDDSPEVQFVVNAMNSGKYGEAARMLTQIPSTGRNARWHYLYALTLHGMGNHPQAEEEMRKAVQLNPNNRDYHALLRQFQQSNQASAEQGTYAAYRAASAGSPLSVLGRVAIGLFAARFFFGLLQMMMYGLQLNIG